LWKKFENIRKITKFSGKESEPHWTRSLSEENEARQQVERNPKKERKRHQKTDAKHTHSKNGAPIIIITKDKSTT
jgi:hypothetical protein